MSGYKLMRLSLCLHKIVILDSNELVHSFTLKITHHSYKTITLFIQPQKFMYYQSLVDIESKMKTQNIETLATSEIHIYVVYVKHIEQMDRCSYFFVYKNSCIERNLV